MMGYENVLLLFLSPYRDGNQQEKYPYFESETKKEVIFTGEQTNDAPVKCLMSCAMKTSKEDNGKKVAFHKILCIVTKETLTDCHDGKTTYQLFEEKLKAYCKEENINSDFEICKIRYNKEDEEKNDTTTEARAMHIYSQIRSALNIDGPDKKKTYMYVDYTGGFRDISFLMTTIIRYLEFADIECKKILYAKLSGEKHIYELNCIYDMYQMINGASEFVSTGNAVQLRKLFEKENIPDLINAIIEFSNSMAVCDMSKIDKTVSDMAKLTEEVQEEHNSVYYEMFKSMIPMIREKMRLKEVVKQGKINYPVLIDWCTDNGLIQQATTLYVEKMPFYYKEKGLIEKYVCVDEVDPKLGGTKEGAAFYEVLFNKAGITKEDRELEKFAACISKIWERIDRKYPEFMKLQKEQKLIEELRRNKKYPEASNRIIEIIDYLGRREEEKEEYKNLGIKQRDLGKFMNYFGFNKDVQNYCMTGKKKVKVKKKSTDVKESNTIRKKVNCLKKLEKKDDWTIGIYNDLYDRMLYYLAMKMLRNRMNHASNSLTDDDRAGIEYLASKGIHFMKEGTDINAEDAQFELDIDTIKEIIREGIAPELKENKKIK